MSLEVKGTVKEILKLQKGKGKDGKKWQKQCFILDTGAEYNPEICFQVFGEERIEKLLDKVDEGEEVTVHFNLSSREFENKYYHNVDAWKIKPISE